MIITKCIVCKSDLIKTEYSIEYTPVGWHDALGNAPNTFDSYKCPECDEKGDWLSLSYFKGDILWIFYYEQYPGFHVFNNYIGNSCRLRGLTADFNMLEPEIILTSSLNLDLTDIESIKKTVSTYVTFA